MFDSLQWILIGVGLTWWVGSQCPAGGDSPDDAVEQETDLLSFWTGQEVNAGPWEMEETQAESK